MFEAQTFLLFLVTALALVVTPGPDTMLILSRTVASGAAAGFLTLLGTQAGNVVHAVLAGVGVSTVILLFPPAFAAMKVAGVAYLLYLAVSLWRSPPAADGGTAAPARGERASRYFLQGLTNNLANPKMIVFFLALFPQFVRPEAGSPALQSLLLGMTLGMMAVAWIGLLVLAVGRLRRAALTNRALLLWANRFAAATFVGLAARLAWEDR